MHSATKWSTSEGNKVENEKSCAEGTTERKSNGNKVKNGHTTRAKPTTGTWEPPRGPASPEKTLTEGALGDPTDYAISIIVVGARLVALAVCVVAHYLVT